MQYTSEEDADQIAAFRPYVRIVGPAAGGWNDWLGLEGQVWRHRGGGDMWVMVWIHGIAECSYFPLTSLELIGLKLGGVLHEAPKLETEG